MATSAYLNHGRWVIVCPVCNNGWVVNDLAPALFFDAQGSPHARCLCGWKDEVTFPPFKLEIDQLMAFRTRLDQRNWNLGESLVDLKTEQVNYGDYVP